MPTLMLEENPPLPPHHSSPTPPQSSESADADTRENLGISHQRRESILVPACRATARAVPVPGAASDAGSRLFLKLHHGQPAGRPIRHLFFPLSLCLFVCLFVCLYVCMFVCTCCLDKTFIKRGWPFTTLVFPLSLLLCLFAPISV